MRCTRATSRLFYITAHEFEIDVTKVVIIIEMIFGCHTELEGHVEGEMVLANERQGREMLGVKVLKRRVLIQDGFSGVCRWVDQYLGRGFWQ